jgi:carbonic anhydrase/acetyltransferase-like protein (isoleucine patch superfamily)
LETDNKLFPYNGKFPDLHESVYLSPGVKIIGDVKIGKNSSVWYNSVVRGDVNYIRIGEDTNIQDLSMLHVTNGVFPLEIGSQVTIGHSVKLHGCTLNDLCLIGIGAIILDGAIVESESVVAAGAVVIPGFTVPTGKLVGGVPAKIIRDLKKEELAEIAHSAERYKEYSLKTIESLNH